VPALDEQVGILMRRVRHEFVYGAALTLLCACRLTQVALVSVRNETPQDLVVYTILPGDPIDRTPVKLTPNQEIGVLKYEEPTSQVTPISEQVRGIRVDSKECLGTLIDGSRMQMASYRLTRPRRWIIRVNPAILRAAGCHIQ
jgi:hypothetical protein